MTIDTEELRQLAQAASPGPWEVYGLDQNGQAIIRGEHIEIATCWHHCVGSIEKEMHANAAFIAAANPATTLELLDRLEAAESDAAHQKALAESALRVAEGWEEKCNALRVKIEAMEKQEPVAWARKLAMDLPSFGCVTDLKYRPSNMPESAYMPLYALPGAKGEEK